MARKSYIIMREKRLVEKSSVADAKEYASLIAVLRKYDIVNETVLEEDDTIDEQTKYTIIHTWPAIVVNAADEWKFFNVVEKPSRCMLDNKAIKTQYCIKNQVNENELIVGSECVKKFGFENGISSVTANSFIAQQQREQRKIRRREDITKLYGNIERQVNHYYTLINEAPVLLELGIYETARRKIDILNNYYENYVDGKERDVSIYAKLKEDVDRYTNDIVAPWVKEQQTKLFACTLEDGKHLEKNEHLDIMIDIRRNGGILDEATIPYLYHANFVKKHLETFRTALTGVFKVINPTPSGLSIGFQSEWIVGIDYNISHRNFLALFGGVLLGKSINLKFSDYYGKCVFVQSNDNVWEMIEALYHFFRKTTYDFLYDEEKYSFLLVGEGRYCDTINMRSLVDILIPKIVAQSNIGSIESTFLSRLRWTDMQSLTKRNQDSMREDIKNLRKIRDSVIQYAR